jgi:transcription elongation factor/antiterminator RfaH
MLNWYLIYTKPKKEDIVSHKLILAGFSVLNSKIKERKCYRKRVREVISSLFPCYIFVKFDNPRDLRFIKYTRGVKRIVGTDNTPTIVSQQIINSINRRMEEGIITIGPPDFKSGEEVVIKDGPFQGFEAVFERKFKGSERVSILLKAINARFVVDGAFLRRADSIL